VKTAKALPVLMYHHVSPSPGLVTVSPETFRDQMEWLAGNGYHTASCDELAGFLAGAPLPDKSVVITFDDGYLDNYVHAYPVLKRLGLHAAIFVITGWLGDGPPRAHADDTGHQAPLCPDHRTCMASIQSGRADEVMLRWSEIEAMRQDGTFEFHSHTHTHARWDKMMDDASQRQEALARDLGESRDTLRRRLGQESTHLCWPQGHFDADYRKAAAAAGFRHLYTVIGGTNPRYTHPELIRRIVVKDKGAGWLKQRLRLYRHPVLSALYTRLRGA
jgi:peptidoglycan/xylan/chitin deacetylase (PgdA/CDA1 family)